jgi:transposase-like protein
VCADKACKKNFTVKSGTIFADSKISLQYWFVAIYMLTVHKKGISSNQLATDLSVTQKSAWFMLHRIRFAVENRTFDAPKSGVFEVEETYMGGKSQWKHSDKKSHKRGRNNEAFQPVFGIRDHQGKVHAQCVLDTSKATLRPIINDKARKGSMILSDEWGAYNGLSANYDHRVVQHKAKEYVAPDGATTNGIENYWSHLKRTVTGTYHAVSPKHLDSYIAMQSFRYNERGLHQSEQFTLILAGTNGKRLTYKALKARPDGKAKKAQ